MVGNEDWVAATPESAGFDTNALWAGLAEVTRSEANLHAVIIERHGQLVAESYQTGPDRPINILFGLWNPFAAEVAFDANTLHDVRSVSKSVVGLLFGIALDKYQLAGVSAPVLAAYPELADLHNPERDAITLEHLLTMTSGLAWDEGALPNDETRLFWVGEPMRFVFQRPLVATPGTLFNYNSCGTTVLAEFLTRVSGQPLLQLVREALFEPLGITQWEWVRDLRGRPLAFTGLRLRPRDMAKLGRLVLEQGNWRGRQIVSAAWVKDSLRPHIATGLRLPSTATEELGYGYQWWTGRVLWKGRELSWSAAFGNGGQRIFVVPELDLTVVITAGAYGVKHASHLVHQIFEKVVSAAQ